MYSGKKKPLSEGINEKPRNQDELDIYAFYFLLLACTHSRTTRKA
jgi:hypothetical protein